LNDAQIEIHVDYGSGVSSPHEMEERVLRDAHDLAYHYPELQKSAPIFNTVFGYGKRFLILLISSQPALMEFHPQYALVRQSGLDGQSQDIDITSATSF
jgi:hypothetical protein